MPTSAEKASNDKLWEELTKPFDSEWIERLPKPLQRNDDNKGRCQADPPTRGNGGAWYSADGHYCNGWHSRSVHLDYVGHAGITMRLNDALGPDGWDLQPYAESADGLPVISASAFWVKLTILGVTKWELAANFHSPQEAIGDALRRAAMRFGIGTYLWSKSEHALNLATVNDAPPEPSQDELDRGQLLEEIKAHAAAQGFDLQGIATTWAQDHDGEQIGQTLNLADLRQLRDDLTPPQSDDTNGDPS